MSEAQNSSSASDSDPESDPQLATTRPSTPVPEVEPLRVEPRDPSVPPLRRENAIVGRAQHPFWRHEE